MQLRAVLFDLDDTLVLTEDADRAAFRCVAVLAEELLPGVNGKQLVNDWRPLFHASPWCPHGKTDVEDWRAQLWLQAMARQGQRDAEAAARLQRCFSDTRLQHFRFPEGVEAMVRRLQGLGLATAIITNGHRVVQRQKLVACQAARLFAHALVGGEEIAAGCGHEKPHPAIFHKACSLVGCQPGEAIHVGDSLLADINGALQAGLKAAIWVNRDGARPLPTGLRPAAILSSVLELPSALEQLRLLPAAPVARPLAPAAALPQPSAALPQPSAADAQAGQDAVKGPSAGEVAAEEEQRRRRAGEQLGRGEKQRFQQANGLVAAAAAGGHGG